MSDVHQEVEAALLNSQGDPIDEVQTALNAVAHFAHTEAECGELKFLEMARQAWLQAQSEG